MLLSVIITNLYDVHIKRNVSRIWLLIVILVFIYNFMCSRKYLFTHCLCFLSTIFAI